MTISHISIFYLLLNDIDQIDIFERLGIKLTHKVTVKDWIGNLP